MMEIVLELPGLELENWSAKLTERLATLTEARELIAEPIRRPPGAMGADDTPRARVKGFNLDTISKLAAILGSSVALYGATISPPKECLVVLKTGQAETTMTYDCKAVYPPKSQTCSSVMLRNT